MSTPEAVLLFDIDGTLVNPVAGDRSPHHRSFEHALQQLTGQKDIWRNRVTKHGMIDSQIALELGELHGVPKTELRPKLEELYQLMINYFIAESTPDDFELMPGVAALLPELKQAGYILGLLTGNLEPIAFHKLSLLGIADYFNFGGFGNLAETRPELVPIAIERASKTLQVPVEKKQVILIGDTPLDVSTALNQNVKVIGVGAASYTVAELSALGAHATMDDLTNTTLFRSLVEQLVSQ